MLAISHGAAEAIKRIVSSSQLSQAGGIRISAEPISSDSLRLDLSLADSPEAGDTIVESEGANVFVEQGVAPLLEDKVLDAAVDADKVSFSIAETEPDWSSNGHSDSFDPRNIA